MNERIKELMEQAKRPLGELRPKMANTGAKWDMVLDPERFAELIVRECCQIVNDYGVEQASDSEKYLGESLKASMKIIDAAWKIKEHFGVEE